MSIVARCGLSVDLDGAGFVVGYRSEAELRSGLAELARAHGWDVQEEVVVPGWGRIDIVMREAPPAAPYLIELKLDLTKPARVRRAFQQADGYGRWWTKVHLERATAVVVAAKSEAAAVGPVADAYPAVAFRSVSALMLGFLQWPTDPRYVRAVAADRAAVLRQSLAIYDRAHADLSARIDAADRAAKPGEVALLGETVGVTSPFQTPGRA